MEYVCTGATLKCTMKTSCPKLKATPKNVSLTGKDQANIADYVSMKNVPSFGRCRSLGYPPTASATAANHGKLTPMPCVPGTCPKWKAIDKDSLICGEPALLKPATLKCMYGGTISIVDPGQIKEVKVGGVIAESVNENRQSQENLRQKEHIAALEDATLDDKQLTNIDTIQAHSKYNNDCVAEREKITGKGSITGFAASLALNNSGSVNISLSKTSKKIDYQGKEVLENWKRILNFEIKQPQNSEKTSYDINKTNEDVLKNYFAIGRGNLLASARVVVDVSSTATGIIYNSAYNEICGSAYPRIIPPNNEECIAGQKCNIQIVIENINNNMYNRPSELECPKYGLLVKSFPNNLNVKKADKYLKLGRKGKEYKDTKKYVYEDINSITNVPIELQSGQTYFIRAYLCAVDLMGYICSYSDTLIIKMIEE